MSPAVGHAISLSEMVKIYPKEIENDMDLLMERMRIPAKSEEPKTELITTRVTREIIDEIINTGSPLYGPTGQHPDEIKHAIEIQTQLRNILGIDLAGYFDVEVSLRNRDSVVRLLYKGTALGIGAGKEITKAKHDAIVGIVPSLKQLQQDLNKTLEVLPWVGAE